MKEHMVFSLVGSDRTGLVDRITESICKAEGNLEDSRMAILGGEFAMVMLCTVEEGGTEQLERVIREASEELGLLMTAKKTSARRSQEGTLPWIVRVSGMDHEGIVHELTHHLVEKGISVELLDSHLTHAPHSGVPLFSMNMRVLAPASLSLSSLRGSLSDVADRLNVDVDVESFAEIFA